MKLWIRAQRAIHEFGISLYPMGEDVNSASRDLSYVSDIVYTKMKLGNNPQDQVGFTLDDDAAKRLMDDLWLSGVRPSEDITGVSDKEDIKNHLEDMRSIVFGGLTVNIKQKKD